jgi:hypothetical protein
MFISQSAVLCISLSLINSGYGPSRCTALRKTTFKTRA